MQCLIVLAVNSAALFTVCRGLPAGSVCLAIALIQDTRECVVPYLFYLLQHLNWLDGRLVAFVQREER